MLARGALSALVATFVALFSHIVGGGEMPAMLGVVVPLVLSLFVSTLLAGRQLSVVRLSIAVGVSQTLFHTLFVLGAPSVSAGASGSPVSPHAHHAAMPMLASDGTIAAVQADAGMWVWHAIGAAITVAVLHRGERSLERLVRVAGWLRHWLVLPVRMPRIVPVTVLRRRPARAVETAPAWTVLAREVTTVQVRRGPPADARNAYALCS